MRAYRSVPTLMASLRLAVLALALGQAAQAMAEGAAISEHAVKAVLFYKLPQFVYLPDTGKERAPNLCGLGGHAIVGALERLARTPAEGRGAAYQSIDTVAVSARCDFLFIARDEDANLDAILHRLGGRAVVTVSDIPGFAKSGGMVEFAQSPEKAGVQILINRKAAQKLGIEFNAQLLRLARIVEP